MYEWVDASKPQSSVVQKELTRYPKNVWVYWDPKFRQSHAVHRAFIKDLKAWCEREEPGKPWVVGMDNLGEQVSGASRVQLVTGCGSKTRILSCGLHRSNCGYRL